jgi:hypothetical protein
MLSAGAGVAFTFTQHRFAKLKARKSDVTVTPSAPTPPNINIDSSNATPVWPIRALSGGDLIFAPATKLIILALESWKFGSSVLGESRENSEGEVDRGLEEELPVEGLVSSEVEGDWDRAGLVFVRRIGGGEGLFGDSLKLKADPVVLSPFIKGDKPTPDFLPSVAGDLRPSSPIIIEGEEGGVLTGEPADSLKFVEEPFAHAPIVRSNFPLPVSDIHNRVHKEKAQLLYIWVHKVYLVLQQGRLLKISFTVVLLQQKRQGKG